MNVGRVLVDLERGTMKLGAILVVASDVAHTVGHIFQAFVVLVQDTDLFVEAHWWLTLFSAQNILVAADLRAGVTFGRIIGDGERTWEGHKFGVCCFNCANSSEGKGDKKSERERERVGHNHGWYADEMEMKWR